jgi:hypothetical protein
MMLKNEGREAYEKFSVDQPHIRREPSCSLLHCLAQNDDLVFNGSLCRR